jgi:hypothetical protein
MKWCFPCYSATRAPAPLPKSDTPRIVMCRWVVYYGDSILLSEILTEPSNSLLKQSAPERQIYTPGAQEEKGFSEQNWHARNHIVGHIFQYSFSSSRQTGMVLVLLGIKL